MSAKVIVFKTEKSWRAIRDFLLETEQGAVVVTPEMYKVLKKEGVDAEQIGTLKDYTFGGEADVFIDICHDETHYSVKALLDTKRESKGKSG